MRIENKLRAGFVFFISIIAIWGCTNEFDYGNLKKAAVTVAYSNVTQTTAEVTGNIITDNGSSLSARGICYSTSDNPTTSGTKVVFSSAALGSYTCAIINLAPSTTYYARAYATNSFGTAYGESVSFTTLKATVPIISSTTTASAITATTAFTGGTITDSGASTITSRGVCYSNTVTVPTIAGQKTTNGIGVGNFVSSLTGLTANTTYYIRAYATNGIGTAYGDVKTFNTTVATIPIGISTNSASAITQTTASNGGNITNDGGASITSRGVCWSNTTTNPTVSNTKTIDGSGMGTFTSSLTALTPGTTYYVRAYATNNVGSAYGNVISFTTVAATIPTGITTNSPSSITQTSASSGGNITTDGGAVVTARGVCWSNTTSSPTTSNSRTSDGTGIGSFNSTITGLQAGSTYYVRAYATNSAGTAYGTVRTFTTLPLTLPSGIVTTSISSINQTTASSGGSISSDGGATISSKGVCWSSTTSTPTISNSTTNNGTGTNSFTSALNGLIANTTYYVRAYATNSVGTAYGTVRSFTTSPLTLPSGIVTTSISSITQTTASSGGSISSDGGATISSKGVCWSSTTTSPTISNSRTNNGTGTNSFSSALSGLIANTTYYVRAYATNSVGTAYGNAISFTTSSNLSVGQSYQGGIIAYILVSGDSGYVAGQTHGLIATTSNQSTGAQWGCSGTSIVGTSTALGTGVANTTAIVNGCSSSTSAAALCNNLSSGGYTDWYLPSYSELNKLYSNRVSIGGFSNVSYWSSSQSSTTTAWSINFSSGANNSISSKNSSIYVRAIRKF
jgi:hypothetical protein